MRFAFLEVVLGDAGSLEGLFSYMIETFKNNNALSIVYETLIVMKIDRGRLDEASELISDYQNLEGGHDLTLEGSAYDFRRDLDKRIGFLKRLLRRGIRHWGG